VNRARPGLSDAALQAWLREHLGLMEYRRVLRENGEVIVISKFEPGFSQDLFATVDLVPELFDEGVVAAEYEALAAGYLAGGVAPLRTAVWREAAERVLGRLCAERGIDARRRMLVLPGVESAQAVLDGILWTAPVIGGAYAPHPGETAAYREFEASAGTAPAPGVRDLFTRFYGLLDGRRVEAYCPGAPYGRRLVAQGWRVCLAGGQRAQDMGAQPEAGAPGV
jgi:hypothetical protein